MMLNVLLVHFFCNLWMFISAFVLYRGAGNDGKFARFVKIRLYYEWYFIIHKDRLYSSDFCSKNIAFFSDTCTVCFKDPDVLSVFDLSVTPGNTSLLTFKHSLHWNIQFFSAWQISITIHRFNIFFWSLNLSLLPYCYIDEGFWLGGKFRFHISIPEEYNIKVCKDWLYAFQYRILELTLWSYSTLQPPIASCKTKIWHPNINEEGQICLRWNIAKNMSPIAKLTKVKSFSLQFIERTHNRWLRVGTN